MSGTRLGVKMERGVVGGGWSDEGFVREMEKGDRGDVCALRGRFGRVDVTKAAERKKCPS